MNHSRQVLRIFHTLQRSMRRSGVVALVIAVEIALVVCGINNDVSDFPGPFGHNPLLELCIALVCSALLIGAQHCRPALFQLCLHLATAVKWLRNWLRPASDRIVTKIDVTVRSSYRYACGSRAPPLSPC